MKLMRLWCALLLLVAPAIAIAQAPVTDDAYVSNASSSVASANNGTSPSLVVQATSGYSYLRFDLSKVLPLNSPSYPIQSNMVAKAALKLYITAVTAGGSVDALEVTSPWCERTGESACPSTGGVTYLTRPADSGSVLGSVSISTTVTPSSYTAGQYVTLDITQAVKDWIDYANGAGRNPNYGIVLKPSSGSSVSATFESKESTTTSHDPELIVTLSGPQGVQGPVGATGTVGPQGPAGPQPGVVTNGGLLINGLNASGTEILTLDATVAATQAGANTFTGANIFKNKVDMSGASSTLPVQAVNAQPSGACTVANAMELWSGGAAGQQLYICRQDPNNPQSLLWSNANDETAITQSVSAETTRAKGAEATLTSNLSTETTRATGAESTLTSNLNAESTRAKTAETTETTRATGAEQTLTTNLATEGTARAQGDAALGVTIGNEVGRAQNAEAGLGASITSLGANLAGEATRATAAEATKADIHAPVQAVNAQPSGACTVANAMELWSGGAAGQQLYICRQDPNNPQSLTWSNANDETAIAGTVTAETTRAEAAESTLTSNLSTETTRATGAEATLTNNLSMETTRAKAAETTETNRATGAEQMLTSNLAAEGAARAQGDAALGVTIGNEVGRAQNAEAGLGSSITSLSANLATETTRATAAEATKADIHAPVQAVNAQPSGACTVANAMELWSGGAAGQQLYICRQDPSNPQTFLWSNANDETAIAGTVTAETTRAEAAESTLTSNLSTETTRATGAEATLTNNLSMETTRAASAEATLTSNLAAEGTARAQGDAALGVTIGNEVGRAQNAEAGLGSSITSLSANLATETTRAAAAEATKADIHAPVQAVNAQPSGACTVANAMELWSGGAAGQQLYICRQDPNNPQSLTWSNANDETAIAGTVTAETTRAESAEANLTSNLATESTRATGAEATLTNNLSSEVSRATGAEQTLTSNLTAESTRAKTAETTETTRATGAEATLTSNLAAESTARAQGDAALGVTIGNEVGRAQNAEAGLGSSITNLSANLATETTRATAAEATKADIHAPVQAVNAQPNGACTVANAMELWSGGAAGQQLYICRQDPNNPQSMAWSNANDETAIAGTVTAETTRAEAAESTLTSNLATETTRATGAEATLTNNLSMETNRATGAEATLTSNLNAESTRAKTAETTETTRATGAEQTLTTNLATESTARAQGDAALGVTIGNEVGRAQNAEAGLGSSITSLGANLATETTRATAAEATKADIHAPVQAVNAQPSGACTVANAMELWSGGAAGQQLYICRQDPNNPQSMAWSNANDETAIAGTVTAETTRAESAEATLTSNLATENTRATGAEATLTNNLSMETNRATGAEATLTSNLNAESTRAKTAETTETNRASGAEQTLTTNLAAEGTARAQGDAALGVTIGNEVGRAQNAEAGLGSSITSLGANLASETTRATAAEATKADIHAPVQAVNAQPSGACTVANAMELWSGGAAGQQLYICRQDPSNPQSLLWSNANDETAIAGTVTAETTRAESAEATLTSNLATENTRATGAEATLTNNLSMETTRATGAEATLTSNLNAESTRAKTAETTETTRATGAEQTLTTNLATEGTARAQGDAALGVTIGNEVGRAQNAEAGLGSSITNIGANLATETTRATAAEATKADIHAPVQAVNAQPNGACTVANAMELWSGGAAGQQLYICRQDPNNPQTFLWSNANDETAIAGTVTAETTRAESAEATLTSNLTTESNRATGAEGTLTSNLSAETTRARAAETTETSRATGAEQMLTSNLAAEGTARAQGDAALGVTIGNEVGRAQNAEAGLGSSITNLGANLATETTRATAAEATKADIHAPVQAVNAQPSGACTVANAMELWSGGAAGQQLYICRQDPNNPQSLTWSNANDETAIAGTVTAETTRAEAAESTLTSNLATETTRATGAEATLTNNLSMETTRAASAEATLTSNLNAESTRAKTAETTETTRATGAEATLTSNLSAETTRAKAAETTETSRATGAEQTLTTNLAGEVTRAEGAESGLSAGIAVLNTSVNTVSSNLTAETARATAAEATLTNNSASKAANTFTGAQTIGPAAGVTAPADSNALIFHSLSSGNQVNTAQWSLTQAGLLSLQFGLNGAAPQQQLSFNADGTINFATTQSFPGNASTASKATALANTPSQCSSGAFATGITATGNANCNQVGFNNLAGALASSQDYTTGAAAGTFTKLTVNSNGRVTSGSAATFSDLAGSVAASQMPALTGDVTSAAGSTATTLTPVGSAGTYTKVTTDAKGRVTGGGAASISDLSDGATVIRTTQTGVVSNAMLANNSINVAAGTGLSGGGSVALGGTVSLSVSSNTLTSGTASGLSQITVTASQTGGSGGIAARTCLPELSYSGFTGLTPTMAIVFTPAGTLSTAWAQGGLTWVAYVIDSRDVGLRLCNGSNMTTINAAQTFNIRFIN